MANITLNVADLHDPTDRALEVVRGPFEHEAEVVTDPVAQHDDISYVQALGSAAARVSAEHFTHLLYTPGYIYDPRSSPRGASYYPQSLDAYEDPQRHQQQH